MNQTDPTEKWIVIIMGIASTQPSRVDGRISRAMSAAHIVGRDSLSKRPVRMITGSRLVDQLSIF